MSRLLHEGMVSAMPDSVNRAMVERRLELFGWRVAREDPQLADDDPDYGEGDTATDEDERFRQKIERQDAS